MKAFWAIVIVMIGGVVGMMVNAQSSTSASGQPTVQPVTTPTASPPISSELSQPAMEPDVDASAPIEASSGEAEQLVDPLPAGVAAEPAVPFAAEPAAEPAVKPVLEAADKADTLDGLLALEADASNADPASAEPEADASSDLPAAEQPMPADFAFIPEPVTPDPVGEQPADTIGRPLGEPEIVEDAAASGPSAVADADQPASSEDADLDADLNVDLAGSPAVVQPDGSLKIGDSITITGKGTEAEPFELPWDLLVDAQRVYGARQTPGAEDPLPTWTLALDGAHVRLKGFLMLPMTGNDGISELLLMRNQWDGCCVGLPPTAFDAVEVSLGEVAKIDRWTTNYGSLVGRFEVDPFLSGGWVIGLWLMKDAKFEDTSGVGTIGHWGGGS